MQTVGCLASYIPLLSRPFSVVTTNHAHASKVLPEVPWEGKTTPVRRHSGPGAGEATSGYNQNLPKHKYRVDL